MDQKSPLTARVPSSRPPKTDLVQLRGDMLSGFFVFLLAMPLSLGIAKASGFPPAMGVLTAMMGGLVASLFKVSPLTIKGPAAGLITVCSGAIAEFGGQEDSFKTVCGIIVVMAVMQWLLGVFKFGAMSDFFPDSTVHGMLAAIGIIIMAKQIPVMLGVDPTLYKGESPIQLILDIPRFFTHSNFHLEVIGLSALAILVGVAFIKHPWAKRIPTPVVLLGFALTLSVHWHLRSDGPSFGLVKIGNFWGSLGFNAQFQQIGTFTFWKYVFMFLFVSSLESLLTVKAVDGMDPLRRESDYNGDLKAQGAANLASGLLGGLPMISEVVRSSANVSFGAKTKASNFFHGLFLLLSMLFLIPVIELTPNSALAAMLVFAGFRLASPKEFIHMYELGKEQLVVFLVTIAVTLAEDLLLGVAAGILVKSLFHLLHGVPLRSFFKVKWTQTTRSDGTHVLTLEEAAIFSSIVTFKKVLASLPKDKPILVDLEKTVLVDSSFMAFITHFQREFIARGGTFEIIGLHGHQALSQSPLAARKALQTNKVSS